MATSPINGVRGSLASNSSNLKPDILDRILNVEDFVKEAVLFTLMNKISGTRIVTNPKFEVVEEVPAERFGLASGAATGAATSVSVASSFGNWVVAGTVLYNPRSQERMLVTSGDANTLIVTRNLAGYITGDGGTTAEGDGDAVVTGDNLTIIGNAFPEGTSYPASISLNTENSYNYTQIIKHTYSLTRTNMNTDRFAGGPENGDRIGKERMKQHLIDINRALWFGVRRIATDATSGQPIRMTGGLFQHVYSNTFDISGAAYGGVLTSKVIEEWMEDLLMNTDDITVFCPMKFAHAVDSIKGNKIRFVDSKSSESYNTTCREYITSNGRVRFYCDKKIFDENTVLQGKAVAVPLDHMRIVYLKGGKTNLYNKVVSLEKDGFDGEISLIQTEFGMEFSRYGLDNSNRARTDTFRPAYGVLTGFSAY